MTSSKDSQVHHYISSVLKTNYMTTATLLFNITHQSHFLQYINKSLTNLPIITKGDSTWKEGTEFSIFFDNRITFYFKMEKVLLTDYYAEIQYISYKTEPISFNYQFTVKIFYQSETSCFIISDFSHDSGVSLPPEVIQNEDKRRRKMLLNFEKRIINEDHMKVNIEQISIQCTMKVLWEIILNLKSLHKYVKLLGESIDYEGNVLENQLLLKVMMNSNQSIFKVTEFIETLTECQLLFTLQSSSTDTTEQLLNSIRLIIYPSGKTGAEFFMISMFKKPLTSRELEDLSKTNRKVIEKIAKIASNYFTHSNQEKRNGSGSSGSVV